MQFNTWIFIALFLPIALIGYYLLNRLENKRIATYYLVVCNLVFYGYAGLEYLIFFIVCILVNYFIATLLIKYHMKPILICGIVLNLGVLGILKYTNFFISALNPLLNTNFNLAYVFLPLGLSFFVFQFVALLYDCFKGRIEELPLLKFMLFTSFFPKIVQGPIMLYQDFDKQYDLNAKTYFQEENFCKGLYAFVLGLGKKVLIADVLAIFVNEGFSTGYTSYDSLMLILLMVSYTMQIYFDFSGYSDMARGIGFMFNMELPQNFNSPYKALSVNEFWKRWHMSLTGFFTKYLYIPLGGNRKGDRRTYLNVMIVFLLSGLWHGANYTFIIWGLMHGVISVVERKWEYTDKMHVVVQWIYTFSFINVAWLFFRANSITQAIDILKGILKCSFSGSGYISLSAIVLPELRFLADILNIEGLISCVPILFIIILILSVLQCKNTDEKIKVFKPTVHKVFVTILIAVWSILSFGEKITFIYEMF